VLEIIYLWSSFNDFANKNFANFIAMTLITAVFGTLILQFIEAFQCSVTFAMKQADFFDCCNVLNDFIVCDFS